ncbi:hypothetical protein AOG27_01080 [Pseudoalteromonas lipolytica]|uniref:Uncharacterized protein n=1 Tax=Pseudoalteromonas lipolytica TaxID=570156 RepID=A0A0P7E717_9GAMM|nr:hypothetical protein AOG27_01080 [Pseudoalteromonas lipolytica]
MVAILNLSSNLKIEHKGLLVKARWLYFTQKSRITDLLTLSDQDQVFTKLISPRSVFYLENKITC